MVSVWIKRLVGWGFILFLLTLSPLRVQAAEIAEETAFSLETAWNTVQSMLWGEFTLLRGKIPSLLILMLLIGLKNCMKFPITLTRTLHLGFFCAISLSAGELFRELSAVAENCITHLLEMVSMTIPVLTGLVANGGRVLSAAKSTYFLLGFMNLLAYLIKHLFFPGVLIFFACTLISALLEKDYFSALKKVILWSIKTVLPIVIGIFMTVFSLMTTVTKASDSMALQSAKIALGNCIPFLGGALSDSGEYLIQTISQIKAQAGLSGVIGISYVFLSPLLKLVAGLLTFRGLSVCAGFLSDEKTALFFEDTATGLGMLTAIVATVSVISVLGIMIVMGI